MPDADPASFTEISATSSVETPAFCRRGRYGKDKNHIYYEFSTLEGSPRDFSMIGEEFAQVKNLVFWKNTRIEETDGKTFKVLGNDIATGLAFGHL